MPDATPSRREFCQTAAAVTAASTLWLPAGAYAGVSSTVRVGLVGCGGRGSGAASQALHADPNNRLVAVGDVFAEPTESALKNLQTDDVIKDRVQVEDAARYVGMDAYKQVIDACDVVLLGSPPGFRPLHFRAAVEAGKHIFTEKPMATDATGVRDSLDVVAKSKEKKLGVVAGFCWRYDYARRELFQRIHEGQIGEVLAVYGTYLTSPVKPMPPETNRPTGMTNYEWMVRNWYNFTWLSGDGLVEQAIHAVDWLAWAMQDMPPARCTAIGGRELPNESGSIWDHIEVNYEWENGVQAFLAQRQIRGCFNDNSLVVIGSKGKGYISPRGVYIKGENSWKYDGPRNNMYQTEHDELFASLKTGTPINDGDRMLNSTLMGIMGRMAGYTGQQVTWEQALNSMESLAPAAHDLASDPPLPTVAKPGLTPLV